MRRTLLYSTIGGVSVVVAVILVFFLLSIPTKDFALDIDPIKCRKNDSYKHSNRLW